MEKYRKQKLSFKVLYFFDWSLHTKKLSFVKLAQLKLQNRFVFVKMMLFHFASASLFSIKRHHFL